MIWIIGGTKDSRDILEKLILNTKKDIIVSTATEYGGKLLEDYIKNNRNRKIKVISERLNEEQMENLIYENSVNVVIDASHPYAKNVSQSIINVTNKINTKYIRFERKMLDYGNENVKKFHTLKKMNNFITF